MKKLRFAGLLLAPLVLLTACGGVNTGLAFQSNWYRNTALGDLIENTYEALEYSVASSGGTAEGYSVDYSGVYKTVLRNAPIRLEEGEQGGYVYETELSLDVKFTVNGQTGETLRDSVKTHVEFLSVGQSLRPVMSKREVVSHSPVVSPESAAKAYTEQNFTYETRYDSALTTATVVLDDLKDAAEPTEKTFDIKGKGTYLDNEEILFALRGLTLSTALSFRTFNSLMESVDTASFRTADDCKEIVDFEEDGVRKNETVDAVSVSLALSTGQAHTLVYAKRAANDSRNDYRNVLLRMETPLSYSLGNLQYTLKAATFTAN